MERRERRHDQGCIERRLEVPLYLVQGAVIEGQDDGHQKAEYCPPAIKSLLGRDQAFDSGGNGLDLVEASGGRSSVAGD